MINLLTVLVIAISSVFLISSIVVLGSHERVLIFTLGKFSCVKGPGLIFILPIIQSKVKVNLNKQEVRATYNVNRKQEMKPVTVDVSVIFTITDPKKAILNVSDHVSEIKDKIESIFLRLWLSV